MTRLYLLRHGEVLGAATRRFIGHLDVPLSPLGERQCVAQATALGTVPLDAVFSSDLVRAQRSAQIIAAPHRLEPRSLPDLREMSMGRWEGLTADEIAAREPAAFDEWMKRIGEFPFPDGESLPDLVARAWPALERIVVEHVGGNVAVVAHGGTNRALLCRALGLPLGRILALGQDYGALSVLASHGGAWVLGRLNERPVLS